MDEHLEFLKRADEKRERTEIGRRNTRVSISLLSVPMVLALGGCPITHVALVSVNNETPDHLEVRARLRGSDSFSRAMDLAPTQEKPLLKYEEGPFTVEPIGKLVKGLELVTPLGCVAPLEGGPLIDASTRDAHATRWTIHLRPDDLPGIRCVPGAPARAPVLPLDPGVHAGRAPDSRARATLPPGGVTPPPHVAPPPPPDREEKQIKN